MTTIMGYTFEADHHCVGCTQLRHQRDGFRIDKEHPEGDALDRNGVPYAATDREGNSLHPIFSTDETPASLPLEEGGYTVTCGDCQGVIIEHYETT